MDVFVSQFGISEDLGHDFLLADSIHLYLLIVGLEIIGDYYAAYIILIGDSIAHLLLNPFHTNAVNFIFVCSQGNTQIS